tara:strand:- start:1171 stop:1740 length:570 start_codon:yes stop_codon:yes gene_type:complete
MTKSAKKTKSKKSAKSFLKNLKGKLKASRKELMSQVDKLSKEVADLKKNESPKKIIKKLEKKYKKQKASLKKDFNKQLDKLNALQSKVVESLPQDVLNTLHITKEDPQSVKSAKKSDTTKAKKASQPKSELSAIKGIGPATVTKLIEAGITTLEDLANTPENKVDALKLFEKTKGFDTWAEQAKNLLSK